MNDEHAHILESQAYDNDDNDENYYDDKDSNALAGKVEGDYDYKDATTPGQIIVILAAEIC